MITHLQNLLTLCQNLYKKTLIMSFIMVDEIWKSYKENP
jgi:hypothetical protein